MPADRFIHPRLGHSEKVNSLTDLEWKVWIQYMLSADDFGVLRCSAVTLQADNDSLQKRPKALIQRCLERVIEIGLLHDFEHQGRRFVFQYDWQLWQKIRYPRETSNPCPPEAKLQECCGETLELFRNHHRDFPETFVPHARASAQAGAKRLTADPDRQLANGLRSTFVEFWDAYPRKVGKEPAWKIWQRLKPGPDLVEVILAALEVQRKSPSWTKDGGDFIPHPKTWLFQQRWTDEVEPTKRRAHTEPRAYTAFECPHEPKCLGRSACHIKSHLQASKASA